MMTRIERIGYYAQALSAAKTTGCAHEAMRTLGRTDLFFLLTQLLGRADADRDWIYEQCNIVQARPNGYLDLWAREHYKSTIITFALTIQDILNNPELTIGIFSHTRPIAKAFLRQIKRELEDNVALKSLYPYILYQDPRKQSPKWSEDDGLIVKRAGNPKEATIEAWGLVDGQPTSKHYALMIYDDVVTKDSVTSPDMIAKTTDSWALSLNLSSEQGGQKRYIGTRYHASDTWAEILRRGGATERRFPATHNGQSDGNPVLLTRERLIQKRAEMGPYIFDCHGSGTLITMADWSQKRIENIVVGDMVVGWANIDGGQAILTPTQVVATKSRMAHAVESTLENGDALIHTPDHKWWTGRAPENGRPRKTYVPLGFGYGLQAGLCQVLDVKLSDTHSKPEHERAAGYLAAILDGEGGLKHRTIQITQDPVLHPYVCEQIEWCLNTLGFDYAVCNTPRGAKVHRCYTIHGGRDARIRLVNVLGNHFGKRDQVISQGYGSRNFGKGRRIKLTKQTDAGQVLVHNIQTVTGNYVAGGYASKNCQMLLNPHADAVMGFKREWLRFWTPVDWSGLNRYILVDPASEKKKANDYTVMVVIGLGRDRNYYVIDFLRDRLNLTERAKALFYLHQRYLPIDVGYEKYGMQSDIEHYQYLMRQGTYHFNVTELGGQMPKNDRIRRLVPIFEAGRFFMPQMLQYTDYERNTRDMTSVFIDEEFITFPVAAHDDMLDCFSRIMDPNFSTLWPAVDSTPVYFTQAQKDWAYVTQDPAFAGSAINIE